MGRNPLTKRETQAATVNVRVEGSGRPGLLFVHGFGCDLTDWAPQVEDLSREYRCIALDLPGHGLSALPTQATIAALAEAVNAEKTRAPGGVVLIGHSMGCRVVVEALSRAPERVVGVILIDGSITGAGGPATSAERTHQTIAKFGAEAFLDRLFADIGVSARSMELRAKVSARLALLDRHFALELSRNAARWATTNATTALAQIKMPMLVIQATCFDADRKRVPLAHDKIAAWVDSLVSFLPRAEIRVISNAGHFVMIEAAIETNMMIREFIDRHAFC